MSHLCDVLLVDEGEHDGHIAVQDPDELREKVEIKSEVDHGEDEGALAGRLVDRPEPGEEQAEGEETEEAGEENICLVDVARLVEVLVPDDHQEYKQTQAGATYHFPALAFNPL